MKPSWWPVRPNQGDASRDWYAVQGEQSSFDLACRMMGKALIERIESRAVKMTNRDGTDILIITAREWMMLLKEAEVASEGEG